MILLIDNYDSFTYNVKQEIEVLGFECLVIRNDQITIPEIKKLNPSKIVISPGPGHPEQSGVTLPILKEFAGVTPVFGICLGLQAIGLSHGAKVIRAITPMHGKVTKIFHEGKGVFQGLKQELLVARYHSLVIDSHFSAPDFEVTARTEDGEIMGARNVRLKQEGVQFHPESIATESGRQMMKNFLTRIE